MTGMVASIAASAALQTGLDVVRRYWKPLALAAVGLATAGYIWWLRHDNASLTSDLAAATEHSKSVQHDLDMSKADAARWMAAAQSAADAVQMQNLAIERQRADLERANQVIADAYVDQKQMQEAADEQIRKWKQLAREHPDQVRELGPIARDALRVLTAP